MAQSQEQPSLSSEQIAERVRRLEYERGEERHEINWIAHRLGWFLTSESFLLGAAIVSQTNVHQWWYGTVATFLLGVFGVFLAVRAGFAVQAAQAVLDEWLKLEHKHCPLRDQQIGTWACGYRVNRPLHTEGIPENDPLHRVASKFHQHLPWLVVLAWTAILVLAVVHSASIMPSSLVAWNGHQWTFAVIALLALPLTAILSSLAYIRKDWRDLRAGRRIFRTPNAPAEKKAIPEAETTDNANGG